MQDELWSAYAREYVLYGERNRKGTLGM
ncbi:hypothetical protein R3I93_018909 [Phoxinus phoxinus]|uniref:Uncharacterized protein n=1 Tax=Phoxinus phoxinus TaxID=58324 RepID=A0AAN9GVV9_9TELE